MTLSVRSPKLKSISRETSEVVVYNLSVRTHLLIRLSVGEAAESNPLILFFCASENLIFKFLTSLSETTLRKLKTHLLFRNTSVNLVFLVISAPSQWINEQTHSRRPQCFSVYVLFITEITRCLTSWSKLTPSLIRQETWEPSLTLPSVKGFINLLLSPPSTPHPLPWLM